MNPNVILFTDVAHVAWSRSAGPYRLATELRKHGYKTLVVEHFLWSLLTDNNYIEDVIDRFISSDTLIVGFSTTFAQQSILEGYKNLLSLSDIKLKDNIELSDLPYIIPIKNEVLKSLKERILKINPNVKFVLGGALKNNVNLNNTIFDIHISGFADNTLTGLVKFLDHKNPFFTYKMDNDKMLIYNDPSASGFNVDHAVIHWDKEDILFENERLPIEISRGCIFKCKFCGFALNGKKKLDYNKSIDVLSNEFNYNFDNYGIKDYWFTDDTFNDTVEKVEGITKLSKSLDFDISYRAYLRLDLLNAHRNTIDMITESGISMAMFGIESLNYENSKLIGKGIHPDKVFYLLDLLKNNYEWNNNVIVMACLILGLPHDSLNNIGWIDDVISDKFSVDYINLNPLYISTDSNPLLQSEFDKNYQQYGYTFNGHPWNWKNKNTGLTFEECKTLTNRVMMKNQNKNRTETLHEHYLNMTKSELTNLSYSLCDPSNILERKKNISKYLFFERLKVMEKYFYRLLNL